MVIDFHTHTFPDKIAASAIKKLSEASHIRPFSDGTAAGLSASAGEAGIGLSVVLPVATNIRQVPNVNDYAAKTNEATEFTGVLSFGCMHPDFPAWKEELSRVSALGLRGIKLHPVYQGVDLDDPRYLRILERAGELGLIVVTHAGLDIGFPGVDRCSPAHILRAVRQAGPVTLVLAHMGGWRQWAQAEELLAGLPVWFDTSFSAGKIVPSEDGCDASGELPLLHGSALLRMIRTFGADRVLFGTDSPWRSQKESLDFLRSLPLEAVEQEAVLGGNARRLLGI